MKHLGVSTLPFINIINLSLFICMGLKPTLSLNGRVVTLFWEYFTTPKWYFVMFCSLYVNHYIKSVKSFWNFPTEKDRLIWSTSTIKIDLSLNYWGFSPVFYREIFQSYRKVERILQPPYADLQLTKLLILKEKFCFLPVLKIKETSLSPWTIFMDYFEMIFVVSVIFSEIVKFFE